MLVTDCYEPATLLAQFKAAGAPQLAAPRRIIRVNELPALGSGKTDYVAIQLTAEAEAVAGEVKNGSAARRIDDRLRDRYVSSGRRLHRPNHKGHQARRSAGGAATKFEFDPTGKGTRGPQWALATLLVIAGEQGSARTLLSKMLRALVDANVAPLRTLLREEHDLFIAANNGHVTTCRPCRRRMHCWRAGRSCRLMFTHFWNFDLLSTY